jgi:transposase
MALANHLLAERRDAWQDGHRQKLPLSDRVYRCPCCGNTLDRDVNASLNIL